LEPHTPIDLLRTPPRRPLADTGLRQWPTVSAATSVWPQRRRHQQRETFATSDRAQLHRACGTGKTLVGRWLAEDLDKATVLIQKWLTNGHRHLRVSMAIVACGRPKGCPPVHRKVSTTNAVRQSTAAANLPAG
jgi:hypothetical protein